MTEAFVHYLWRYRRFRADHLRTTMGQPLEIVQPGALNPNAGPDFTNARIRIGDTLWGGNVEIHLKSSDWYRHGHQQDPAYASVILHVVLEEDKVVYQENGSRIPCLEIGQRIPHLATRRYQRILRQRNWIPCASLLQENELPAQTLLFWLERMVVERMEQKTISLEQDLEAQRFDWESVFYRSMARNLGGTANAQPMYELARRVPLALIRKHRHSLLQIEALLFGQSGLLETSSADYPEKLQREYQFLRHKYQLPPSMPVPSWKFSRMRPAGFPTIRIAQLATILFQTDQLFSKSLAAGSVPELGNMFDPVVSPYWKQHYRFGQPSAPHSGRLGEEATRRLIINTVVPMIFLFGKLRHRHDLRERALQLLTQIPAEQNQLIRKWGQLRVAARDAAHSQALIHLKKAYCDAHRCLECRIGHILLKGEEAGN